MINEVGRSKKHFILMGDFNYRFIHWPPLLNHQTVTKEAADFYHCLEDNFCTQHVEFCTREDAILDLIISDEQNMVRDLVNMGPFPGSDHNALFWTLVVGTSHDTVSRNRFDYNKADIPALKTELGKVNWHELMNNLSAEDSWNVFREILEDLEYRYIPVKMLSSKRQ